MDNIYTIYKNLDTYERIKFLTWVAESDPYKFEYGGIPQKIRAFYLGPMREEDINEIKGDSKNDGK